ncbi:glycosyltransferase family 4 protein [Cryomorpha ignava]|uniref:Glycosyltransferase family 4 protein n=1 Tax=Cryomorpha ignava TaxID=101383 RepID=A0A7K3WMZ3_9FLAO|nr:glycosyltransferase family 4 protein [Cryomorpha ignava]NEN22242.1 glycosyltransferase family 4 protein [Cryomorpha ignava]
MKVLVSHPTGNANVRAVIDAFNRSGILFEFNTTVAVNPEASWLKVLPKSLRDELLRRKYDIHRDLIVSYPFREMGRLGFGKLGWKNFTKHEYGKFSVDAVYRSLDTRVTKRIEELEISKKPDAVYTYEDGALATFKKASQLNIKCIYDLPKGYWRAERDLLGKEREKRPEWATTLAGFKDSDQKLRRKDLELEYAQHIIVASSFTKSTLSYYPGNLPHITVIPYGFPPVIEDREYTYTKNRKLKLLFVGSLSQLKGIANVLEAVNVLGNQVELTIVGRKSTEACLPLNVGLSEHRYISSLPHQEVLREMSNHDVFVFPSLFEGFGMVVTEAMSQGTPVITTNRTCGADVISHNENGWIVEASSTSAIVSQIKLILESPYLIEKVGRAAMDKARTRPWAQYGIELVEVISSICKDR